MGLSSALPVAVVTGGTSGIGLAIVHDLARDHYVYALGRNKEALEQLQLLENVEAVDINLLDFAAQQRFIDSLPTINALIHSAAISERARVDSASAELWQKQFSINLFAPAELTRLALPALRETQGQVVFINSGSGTQALAGHTVYSASKFALNALAHGLRGEESANGVRVATVSPGPTDTPMNQKSRERAGDFAAIDPLEYSLPVSVAAAVRLVINASEETQITDINVRPRHDKAKR
ncbi:SDR family oxidoreductase [Erwiniaceae bacterium BAC15a-03b]|uniref:SDR family oxidoreductase n=1 Tax=Winslowiella arboricola TaxID=2978220 RepID=A0A9J6PTF6_9GAMM|nr:SDR family oxidoreductase [Winslowiella arboricola]MCU5772467.1 SDR family oxidoreductase [Winslowiella arboricola]MCU5779739.1 SDR family oxidoreductase [Winslowiella arboricola]